MLKKKTIPDRREIIIIASFLQGETLAEIGNKFGLSRERVRQILKRYGYTGKDGGETFRIKEKIDEIKKLASLGVSMESIAKRTGLDKQIVKSYARKAGIKLVPDREKMHLEIKRLHDEGLNQNQIARIVNTAQTNVSQILKNKFGIVRKEVNIEVVKKYHNLGYTPAQIAEKLNATWGNVYRILTQKIGVIPFKRRTVITDEIKNKIKELSSNGVKPMEISNSLKISINTVYRYRKGD